MHKEFSKPTIRKQSPNHPISIWAKDMNRYFTGKDIHIVNKHMKSCSALSAGREKQIKTTMNYHRTSIRMTKMKKSDTIKCWQEYRETISLIH